MYRRDALKEPITRKVFFCVPPADVNNLFWKFSVGFDAVSFWGKWFERTDEAFYTVYFTFLFVTFRITILY